MWKVCPGFRYKGKTQREISIIYRTDSIFVLIFRHLYALLGFKNSKKRFLAISGNFLHYQPNFYGPYTIWRYILKTFPSTSLAISDNWNTFYVSHLYPNFLGPPFLQVGWMVGGQEFQKTFLPIYSPFWVIWHIFILFSISSQIIFTPTMAQLISVYNIGIAL